MSQHWYNKEGALVDPWIKGALPSPSTILDVVRSSSYDAMLRRMGLEATDELMSNAAARGTRIHKACELIVDGSTYGEAVVDAELEEGETAYLDGFVNWLAKYNPVVKLSEAVLFSEKYKYAGRVDLVVDLKHDYDDKYDTWIIDIKTGQDSVRHGLQLKFYQQAYGEMTGTRARMGVLALDGKRACGYRNSKSPYGLQEYKEPLTAIKSHIDVFKWWNKKQPTTEPKGMIAWNGPVQ